MRRYLSSLCDYVTKDESFRVLFPVNVCFFFISVAMYGGNNIQVIVLDSADPPINGYDTQTLYWAVSTPAPLMLPFLLRYVHIKLLLILCSVGYTLLSAMLIYPLKSVVYICSTLAGIATTISLSGGSVLIATVSSRLKGSEAKNSGLWYLFQMASLLLCNTIVYIAFKGRTEIDEFSRYAVSIPLTAAGIFGVIIACFLNGEKLNIKPSSQSTANKISSDGAHKNNYDQIADGEETSFFTQQTKMLWAMVRTLNNWKALCLYSTGVFLGMKSGFWMVVAQTAVGYSLYIKNNKEIMGIMGFSVGIGELSASFLYTSLTSTKNDNGIFSWLFMTTALIGYYILFLILPPEANLARTYQTPYYSEYTLPLLILAGLMIGASDYLTNAQSTSIVCKVFKYEDSTPYFSMLYVLMGVGGAILFYTGDKIQMNVQLLVLSLLTVEACIVFMFFDVYATASDRRRDTQNFGNSI